MFSHGIISFLGLILNPDNPFYQGIEKKPAHDPAISPWHN